MPEPGAGAGARCGRRHGRSFVSGRGAGGGARQARHRRPSRDRPARGALWRRLRRASDSCRRQRDAARAQSDRPDQNRRHARPRLRSGVGADRPAQARRGHRLRRLSDHPAGPGRDLARRAEPHSRRQCRDRARQPAVGAARHRDRHDVPRRVCRRARFGRQGNAHRQSGSSRGRRRRGNAISGRERSVAAPHLRRQPGRARHGRYRACRDPPARRRPARAASPSSSRRARRIWSACARLTPISRSPRKLRRFSPICRRAWRRAIW